MIKYGNSNFALHVYESSGVAHSNSIQCTAANVQTDEACRKRRWAFRPALYLSRERPSTAVTETDTSLKSFIRRRTGPKAANTPRNSRCDRLSNDRRDSSHNLFLRAAVAYSSADWLLRCCSVTSQRLRERNVVTSLTCDVYDISV